MHTVVQTFNLEPHLFQMMSQNVNDHSSWGKCSTCCFILNNLSLDREQQSLYKGTSDGVVYCNKESMSQWLC